MINFVHSGPFMPIHAVWNALFFSIERGEVGGRVVLFDGDKRQLTYGLGIFSTRPPRLWEPELDARRKERRDTFRSLMQVQMTLHSPTSHTNVVARRPVVVG